MRLVLLAVGKVKESCIREAIDGYIGRIAHYVPFEEIELREVSAAQLRSDVERRLPDGAKLVALEVGGRSYASAQFARALERWGSHGKGIVAFLIGGAEGIPSDVLRLADEQLSLSTMTLPHRLARLVLCEQVYRAMTILRGEPYAR